jgi:hypothetical protein
VGLLDECDCKVVHEPFQRDLSCLAMREALFYEHLDFLGKSMDKYLWKKLLLSNVKN